MADSNNKNSKKATADVKISRKDVIKTHQAVCDFITTIHKINLASDKDLWNFKTLNLPWFTSKTINLHMKNNRQNH